MITGGIINAWGSNARLGKGRWMIVEADESDGTFTRLPTEIGVVTNIDPEHLDYFRTVEAMHREYEAFYRNIPFYGLAVTCIDHPVVREMVDRLELKRDGRRLLTYGASENADLILRAARTEGRTMLIDADLGARVKGGARVHPRLAGSDPGPSQRAQCPGGHRRCGRSRPLGRRDPFRARVVLGRQAPLPAYGHVERHSDLSTTTAITRPRSRPCCRQRARAPAGVSSPSSSRIATRACAISSAISPPASRAADNVIVAPHVHGR